MASPSMEAQASFVTAFFLTRPEWKKLSLFLQMRSQQLP